MTGTAPGQPRGRSLRNSLRRLRFCCGPSEQCKSSSGALGDSCARGAGPCSGSGSADVFLLGNRKDGVARGGGGLTGSAEAWTIVDVFFPLKQAKHHFSRLFPLIFLPLKQQTPAGVCVLASPCFVSPTLLTLSNSKRRQGRWNQGHWLLL